VNSSALVLAFGEWGRNVATTLSAAERPRIPVIDAGRRPAKRWRRRAIASRLVVVVAAGAGCDDGSGSDPGDGADALRSGLNALGVTHLTIERDKCSVWVGPTVVPVRPGCDTCWQARRRQHAQALTHAPEAGDMDLVALAARAAHAVMRRVLTSPETEAGVVRRFLPDGGPPAIGRVVPVAGCMRCDSSLDSGPPKGITAGPDDVWTHLTGGGEPAGPPVRLGSPPGGRVRVHAQPLAGFPH
jgi:hypothetical protein